ncbi:MAG: sugar phosphate isomerase/epimerase [Gemmataceae bacterium]|nr:sugar phosphate isomerase/epimerase [Gemmataceae bacterium]
MFVAASTDCFSQLPLGEALARLVDLEYTSIEIALREDGRQLKPSDVLANLESATHACRTTHRLTPCAYYFDMSPEDTQYYAAFGACCKLARATKVVAITVPSSELGTPFNAEIERLRELVRIAHEEQVLVGMKTQSGCLTEDPTTAQVLCDNVKGLGITLDPSHYLYGPKAGANFDNLFKYVYHVHLRDTNKKALQVRIGQGEVEYGKLVTQLGKFRYDRALCVQILDTANADVDHAAELRKLRLLLESLL